ncbi:S9 family peptidase [Maribellus luteus]|uniref:S9 family peptidase n=1 Tax=Maribellus luteus TaxID=2305463 RepID=A0A399T2A7_9BACT|nr:prolyl oligopeptidase family serine peptidase [Maribellus luteus]RIJ48281.1 S9 family peptidase [Maribellus luteus]
MRKTICTLFFSLLFAIAGFSQSDDWQKDIQSILKSQQNMGHAFSQLAKQIDDVLWYERVGDIAFVDKLYIYGPPKWKEQNPTAKDAGNPVKFWTYVFMPANLDASKKYPLIVLPHGGVHGDFTTYYTHIVRELISQGYVIVAPEYRGSTGYGKAHYEKIDYGGLEVEDVYYSRNYMIENYDFVDKNRVGIIGWSHGGLITLMNIFDHPNDFQVAFAGVPVSDLIARMGYHEQSYRDLYEADYHIGKSANDNVAEYRRRSPAWNTHKYKGTPLLIHTNTNDEDVNVLEVEHLIKSLKAEGLPFEYEIFENIPGGHSFDRMDTRTAKEIRLKIYAHLAKQLKPEKPIKNLKELQKAGYKF